LLIEGLGNKIVLAFFSVVAINQIFPQEAAKIKRKWNCKEIFHLGGYPVFLFL
jgi:hypothetical protein